MTVFINIALMLFYVSVSAYGLFLIKSSKEIFSSTFLAGVAMYGFGFLLWLWILMRLPLSVAFPIAAGSLIVATVLVGFFLLGEPVAPLHAVGIIAILSGIFLIFLFAE